ncbi:chorismate mutase [Photobacterium sp. TLY01]|uniref:chorismate mutase n=1 Tax=Photobacterium sp. TLY01 TaxID=2907534 RepID=UPI001F19AC0C|nr:chorismate mutase [Photobacterium sp. TLY01]UIP27408.1 chorismate mutase [Photobacterium sp. TLY01]
MVVHKQINDAVVVRELKPYRDKLDEINEQIIALLASRMDICRTIANVKSRENIPMMQKDRVEFTLNKMKSLSVDYQLNPSYIGDIFERIIHETCEEELVIIKALSEEKEK